MAKKAYIHVDIDLTPNQYEQLTRSLSNDYIDNSAENCRRIGQIQAKLKNAEVINGVFDPDGAANAQWHIDQQNMEWK